jgi:hypothetical protein
MKAQWDEGGRRILRGDDRSSGTIRLLPIRFPVCLSFDFNWNPLYVLYLYQIATSTVPSEMWVGECLSMKYMFQFSRNSCLRHPGCTQKRMYVTSSARYSCPTSKLKMYQQILVKFPNIKWEKSKFHNEELNNLNSSPNIIRKSNQEEWDGRGMWHVWGREQVHKGFWWVALRERDAWNTWA